MARCYNAVYLTGPEDSAMMAVVTLNVGRLAIITKIHGVAIGQFTSTIPPQMVAMQWRDFALPEAAQQATVKMTEHFNAIDPTGWVHCDFTIVKSDHNGVLVDMIQVVNTPVSQMLCVLTMMNAVMMDLLKEYSAKP